MEKYIDEYVPKEELDNEKYKNEAKKNLKQLLSLENDLFTEENKEKILNYINNPLIHKIFLMLIKELRVNYKFEKSELFIKTIGECFNKILEEAEKKNDFDISEDCIMLSLTFYYKDKNSGNKIYAIEFLKNNKWITSSQYWCKRIDIFYMKDIEKIKKSNTMNWENLDMNIKNKKKGKILFSQIAPSIQNMFAIGNDKIFVFKVVNNILQKYNYLEEVDKNRIYNMIGIDKSDIDKIENEIKNNNKEEVKENELKNDKRMEIDDENKEINKNIDNNENIGNKRNNNKNENNEINNNDEINDNKKIINYNNVNENNEIKKDIDIKENNKINNIINENIKIHNSIGNIEKIKTNNTIYIDYDIDIKKLVDSILIGNEEEK